MNTSQLPDKIGSTIRDTLLEEDDMRITGTVSKQTWKNWLIDAGLFSSALLAALSGIYFLFLPCGGYQGGRNPWYDVTIVFTRHTWDDIHTWAGMAMIAVAVIHLTLHWTWVVSMARRAVRELRGQVGAMNARGRFNLALNLTVALSFLACALSGMYFLFFPGGQGMADPGFLFSRLTWDLIHTWSAILLIIAGLLHFAIHWKWVVKVTRGVFTPNNRGIMLGERTAFVDKHI
jgi:hypothetical protein